jgi:rRNA maturation RNase YbeY
MIDVVVHNAHPHHRVAQVPIRDLVRRVCRGEGVRRANVSVVFVDSRRCRALNRKFLRHDYVTDVLSFPLDEPERGVEGEVYVNLDRARKQAREYGVSASAERDRLVVHGTLHLLGHDDRTGEAARRMHLREDWYLSGSIEGKGDQS